MLATSRLLERLARSDTREESRAEPENPERLINAMVQRITRIVMTTMSSTRVNQYVFLFMNALLRFFVFIYIR